MKMKLSSLNRFKGKNVDVIYWDNEDKEEKSLSGRVEEVEEKGITIDFETGLHCIAIDDLIRIEEA